MFIDFLFTLYFNVICYSVVSKEMIDIKNKTIFEKFSKYILNVSCSFACVEAFLKLERMF